MKDCYIKARAYVDYLEFEEIAKSYNNLYSLYEAFNGHNYDEIAGFFDCNYKSICLTVNETANGLVISNWIEVWDDNHAAFIGYFNVQNLKSYINED